MFKKALPVLLLSCGALLSQTTSPAQAAPPSQMLDAASLGRKAAELMTKARAAQFGVASEVLLTRPDGNIQMAVRVKSGQGEWHHDDADVLIGVEGSAQIITGGEIVNGKETAPGEIRGDGVKGGTTQTFKAGDYIRIEPQVAHQVLLTPGTTMRYMAVKVRVTK